MRFRFFHFLQSSWQIKALFTFILSTPILYAQNIFEPFFAKNEAPFTLESFQQTSYHITYAGFVNMNHHVSFLLKNEQENLFSLHPGETKQGIRFVESDNHYQTIILEDLSESQKVTLSLGKTCKLPNRFTGILRRKSDGKTYSFSEKPLSIDEQTTLFMFFHESNLYLIEQTEGEEPFAYRLFQK